MGHKKVCLNCRKAFNDNTNIEQNCSECGSRMNLVNHKFRPPKNSDLKAWKVSEYLIKNGFLYQHIYKNFAERNGIVTKEKYVDYPVSLKEAKKFVEKFKDQAIIK